MSLLDYFWIEFIDYKHSCMPKTETFVKDSENYFASILDNFYLEVVFSFCYIKGFFVWMKCKLDLSLFFLSCSRF